MARLRAEIKRAQLRKLWRDASAVDGATVLKALEAFQDQGFALINGGRKVANTSGNGYAVSFVPQLTQSELSEEEFVALSEEYFEVYADAVSAQSPGYTETDVFNTMMGILATVREQSSDRTLLRMAGMH